MTAPSIQFVRVDLDEKPKPGTWTAWVKANDQIHEWSCEYGPCMKEITHV